MKSEWPVFTVEDLIASNVLAPPMDGNHGSIHPKASDFLSSGVPFVMASDLVNGQVDFKKCVFLSETEAKKLRKGFAKTGDVLLSHKATIGRTALVQESEFDCIVLTPQITYYRILNANKLNNRYLKYYFDSTSFQKILMSWAGSGSTRSYLGITAQRKLPIICPPIQSQKALASILASFDDKIENLHKTNVTLEAIAQALFKSWFIDFDPVRAKAEGCEPEGIDAKTAALFPDSFEESELGLVPQGWVIKQLGEVVQVLGGGTPSTKEPLFWMPEECHWVTPKDLSGISSPILLNTGRKISQQGLAKVSSGLLPINTLLMSSRAPIGYFAITKIPTAINQGFIAMLPHPELSPVFLLLWCQRNIESIKQKANGSTFLEISKSSFRQILMVSPPANITSSFNRITDSLFEKITQNERQIQSLVTLRDILLPRLISGQLQLPEDEEMVELS